MLKRMIRHQSVALNHVSMVAYAPLMLLRCSDSIASALKELWGAIARLLLIVLLLLVLQLSRPPPQRLDSSLSLGALQLTRPPAQ